MDKHTEKLVSRILQVAGIAVTKNQAAGSAKEQYAELGDSGFALVDEAVDLKGELTKEILKNREWNRKFSEKHINRCLEDLLGKVLKEEDTAQARQSILSFFTHLDDFSTEHTVYVPLSGIQVSVESLSIGNIILKRMGNQDVQTLVERAQKVIERTTSAADVKTKASEIIASKIKTNLIDAVCAEFKAIAVPDRARERAIEETLRALELLRYAIPALYPPNYRVGIGLHGEVYRYERYIPTLSIDDKHFSSKSNLLGPLVPFDLNEKILEKMKEIGVLEMAGVLGKTDQEITDFESTLLRAVHWFSSALNQTEQENQLLNLITCLESLLTPRGANPIRTAVAEGVALLIVSKPEERLKLKRRITEFYDRRSAISHGGYKEVFESDIWELTIIAGNVIMTLIRRRMEFKSQNELLNWLEVKRLSG